MSKKKNKISRREALKKGAAVGAITVSTQTASVLLESLIASEIHQAKAATGFTPRTYIHLFQRMAPPRYGFDLFLVPNDGERELAKLNPMISTSYVKGEGDNADRYVSTKFETVKIGDFHVPYIWSTSVPKVGGGLRPMADLLKNLISVRGVDSNEAHTVAQSMTMRGPGAQRSLSAISADYSSKPLDSVNFDPPNLNINTPPNIFFSQNGRAELSVTGGTGNLVQQLLEPFQSSNEDSKVTLSKSMLSEALQKVRDRLNQNAANLHPDVSRIVTSQKSVEKLIEGSFSDLENQWNALISKYEDLVARTLNIGSADGAIPGVTDFPVGPLGDRDDRDYSWGAVLPTVVELQDMRELFTSSVTIPTLVESFAMIEYITVNKLSDSITASLESFNNMIEMSGTEISLFFDEHRTGKMLSVIINAVYNRALAACMLELFDQLKANNLFEDTVINLCSEFNRKPRGTGPTFENQFGNDHGNESQSFSFFSGSIKKMQIIGNIRIDSHLQNYYGTWGARGKNQGMDSEYIDHSHILSTLSTMLRVPSSASNRQSLVFEENGEFKSLVPTGKLVNDPPPDSGDDD